jgi:murein DD-endopeptidase MepM/ murein hydrolase activator NlpD
LEKEINDLDSAIAAKLGNTKLKPGKGMLAWPMKGTLTQGYGNTGFRSLGYSFHNGLDIAAAAGTPIYAAADGTVEATGTGEGAYGNWVAIKHETGKFTGKAVITLYAHMSSFRVKTGQAVKMGTLVGFEGNTGNTTRLLYGPHRGYHLHFTVFDARGFGIAAGANTKAFGPYQVPYGAPYNPLEFL